MKTGATISICRALADKYDIEVIVKGSTAYATEKQVVIPDLGLIDDEKLSILRGYIDHEAVGHKRFTDFSIVNSIEDTCLFNMFNIIEDVFVEKHASKMYPGTKKNLTLLNDALFKDIKQPLDAVDSLLLHGFKEVSREDILVPTQDGKAAKRMFGNDIFKRMDACVCSRDNMQLAMELNDIINGKNPPKEDHNDQGSMDFLPEHEEKEGEEQEEKEGKGKEGKEKEGKEKEGKGKEKQKELKEMASKLLGMESKEKKTARILDQIHEQSLFSGQYVVFSKEGDEVVTVDKAHSDKEYQRLYSELGSLNMIRRSIARIFQSKKAIRWIGDRDNGKINNRALASVSSGNIRLFKEREKSVAVNTAATFLIDCSGSMMDDKIRTAFQAAILFLETLDSISVKSEILGYTTCGICSGCRNSDEKYKGNYGRVEKLMTYVFKTFDEKKTPTVKRRLSNWGTIDVRENCDPCSVRVAYERILKRPEPRKILFVLTDGSVANRGNCDVGRNELSRLVKEIETEKKVDIIAVDLMSGHTNGCYQKRIVVKRPDNLPKQLLDGMKMYLM